MDAWHGYTLVGRVAEQRRSRVWKAHDDTLGRDVAIKELVSPDPGELPSLLEQWRHEARVLAALDHPNVVAVYELQAGDASAAIVEEWVEGATLSAVLTQHGRLETQQAMAVARGALRGLAHAHDRGVVHGDVSPSNVIVDVDGESRLIDFGLASGGAAGTAGSSGGTPAYRAPEVLAAPPTAASDVYSSAAVVAMLLRGESSTVPASEGVPQPVRGVLDKALDPDPARRYPDAGTFLAALEEAARSRYGPAWWSKAGLGAAAGAAASAVVAESAVSAGSATDVSNPPTTVTPLPAKAGRGRGALIGAGALVAALLVGGGAYAMSQRSDPATTGSSSASSAKDSLVAAAAGGSATSPTTSERPANWPGSYTTHVVLTKITGGFFDRSSIKVGQTSGTHFTLTALCGAGPCDINAVSDKGTTLQLAYTTGAWLLTQSGTAQCGVVGQKLTKATTHYTDKLVLKSSPWSDQSPPTFTGTETVVYAPCKGAKTSSSLTYSVSVTPSAP
jgi:eukaryotic-like serine/threonine-protein kinase